jgi:hypothetical protein
MRVIIISGSMGSGKTTALGEASDLLAASGVAHAALDLDALNMVRLPVSLAERVTLQNLAAIFANFRNAGVQRLLLAVAVESRDALEQLRSAMPGAECVVCRLTGDVATMEERVRAREPGMLQAEFVGRVKDLDAVLAKAAVETFTVSNGAGRSITDAARELLDRAGWLVAHQ